MLTVMEAVEKGWGDRAPEFVSWLTRVDARVERVVGVGIDDLPDWDFASAFEDGLTPEDATFLFLEYVADDFGFELSYL